MRTIGDLAATPEPILSRLLGISTLGICRSLPTASTTVTWCLRGAKSVGYEETFEHDLDDDETLLRFLALAGKVVAAAGSTGTGPEP